MSTLPDHYATLGLTPEAEPDAIAAAYRRLARLHHPDVSVQPDAAERMRAINAAYAILADPRQRAAYDARLRLPKHPAAPRVATGIPARPAAPRAGVPAPQAGVQQQSVPRRAERATNVLGVVFLSLFVGFAGLTCVLSSRLPTRTGADGMPVIPRATATALARPASAAPTPVPPLMAPLAAGKPTNPVLRDHPLLKAFGRPVLVPPSDLAPFTHLTLQTHQISGAVCAGELACAPRYEIQYGDWRTAGARLAASGGRGSFDSATPRAATCPSDSSVCMIPSSGGGPAATYVLDMDVRQGDAAFARLQACCPGPFWLLVWHHAATDTTYRLELSGGATDLSPTAAPLEGAEAGAALAAIASALVHLH